MYKRALVADDEQLARQRVLNLLKEINEIQVIAECATGTETIKQINNEKPDLVFLDIQMKDINGFDVIQKMAVEKKPLVIFITAYDEFALKAFDFFAFDYLLKPFKDERFFMSVNKALEHLKNQENQTDFESKLEHLMKYLESPDSAVVQFKSLKLPVKTGNKIAFIDKASIKYIKASGYYAEVYTEHKKYLLRESLSNLIQQLNPLEFIRIHRSTIINITQIEELKHSSYGEVDVKMKDEKLFRISKSYKKEFMSRMGL